MKAKTIALLAGIGLTLSTATTLATWTSRGVPNSVYSGYAAGDVYVGGLQNVGGCRYGVIRFQSSDSDPAKVQRIATAALLAGKELSCNVSGCVGSYQSGRQCRIHQ